MYFKMSLLLAICLVISGVAAVDSEYNVTVNLVNGLGMDTLRLGENLQLLCVVQTTSVAADGGGSFQWIQEVSSSENGLTRNISSMASTTRVTITEDVLSSDQITSRLTITDATRNEGGSYQCRFTTVSGVEYIGVIAIRIAYIPTPECFRNNDQFGNLQFALCRAEDAYPDITIQWISQLNDDPVYGSMSDSGGFVYNYLDLDRLPAETDINDVVCVVRNSAFPDDSNTCVFRDSEEETTTMESTTERKSTTNVYSTTGSITKTQRPSTEQQTDTLVPTVSSESTTGTTQSSTTSRRSTNPTKTADSTTKTPTTDVSKNQTDNTGDENKNIFETKEIIITAAAGGVGLIVLVIVVICCARVCCRTPRPEKFARTDISYDTSYLSEQSPSVQAFVADTFGSTEYYVLDKMKDLDKKDNVAYENDSNAHPVYAAVNKSMKDKERSETEQKKTVLSVPMNLYDSVTDW